MGSLHYKVDVFINGWPGSVSFPASTSFPLTHLLLFFCRRSWRTFLSPPSSCVRRCWIRHVTPLCCCSCVRTTSSTIPTSTSSTVTRWRWVSVWMSQAWLSMRPLLCMHDWLALSFMSFINLRGCCLSTSWDCSAVRGLVFVCILFPILCCLVQILRDILSKQHNINQQMDKLHTHKTSITRLPQQKKCSLSAAAFVA